MRRADELLYIETDGGCASCGLRDSRALTIHHLVQTKPKNENYDNKIILCHNCHQCHHQGKGPTLKELRCRPKNFAKENIMRMYLMAIICICFSPIDATAGNYDRYPPSLTVESLPQEIDIPGYIRVIRDVKGFKATITNVRNATFFVPDGRKLNTSCKRASAFNLFCTSHPGECSPVVIGSCYGGAGVDLSGKTCADFRQKDKSNKNLAFPLYTLKEWSQIVAPVPPYVMVNANWFNINGPPSINFPHNSPCTEIFGYSVNAGREISPLDNPDTQAGEKLDVLLILASESDYHRTDLSILTASQLEGLYRSRKLLPDSVLYAVGGFILAEGGKVRADSAMAKAAKPAATGARSAIGLADSGDTMHIVVVQSGKNAAGVTAKELALYMTKVLRDTDVLNLDNSGSSQFLYNDGHSEGYSLPGDDDGTSKAAHRPIPNFLSVSAPSGYRYWSCAFSGLDGDCKTPAYRDVLNPDLRK